MQVDESITIIRGKTGYQLIYKDKSKRVTCVYGPMTLEQAAKEVADSEEMDAVLEKLLGELDG